MKQINAAVDWARIDPILIRNYPVGKSHEGNAAYPPLLLLKCLLLQQWFRIDSDPELETQIETFAQLHKTSNYVIPAKAGIQYYQALPGFRFSPE